MQNILCKKLLLFDRNHFSEMKFKHIVTVCVRERENNNKKRAEDRYNAKFPRSFNYDYHLSS